MSLFDTPSTRIQKYLKYDENQPRDESGRWTAGGVARTALGGVAAAGVLAAAGVPVIRNIPGLRNIRNKVLGARTIVARRQAEKIPRGSVKSPGGLGFYTRNETQAMRANRQRLIQRNEPLAGSMSQAELRRARARVNYREQTDPLFGVLRDIRRRPQATPGMPASSVRPVKPARSV